MSEDNPFTPFDLPDAEVPSDIPPMPDPPRRRGPRPGSKRGPRKVPSDNRTVPPRASAAIARANLAAEKRGKAPPVALYAEVFGALAQPEAQAVAHLVQAFSTQSQAAIARAVLKLVGEA